jgi:tetratricopeptide (TPR) repeat protein
MLGDAHAASGRYEEAILAYEKALVRFPTSAAVIGLFHAHRSTGEREKAMGLLHDWLRQHPNDVSVKMVLANARSRDGDLLEAKRLYEELIEVVSEEPRLHNELAWVAYKLGESSAVDHARRAVELDPKAASSLDTLGWILLETGQARQALPLLRGALARAPDVAVVRYHLGGALLRLGRDEEAREQLRRALDLDGEFDGAEDARRLIGEDP